MTFIQAVNMSDEMDIFRKKIEEKIKVEDIELADLIKSSEDPQVEERVSKMMEGMKASWADEPMLTKIGTWFSIEFDRIKDWLPKIFRRIKWFIQRGKRGFSDRDVWGFHYYISEVISDGIRHLRLHNYGYPANIESPEEWDTILAKIERAFRLTEDDECMYSVEDGELVENKEIKKQLDEGFALFREYYLHLWD